ncbi:MAG: adenylyl-sulfate kinase [Gemmatimonadota bacterium]|nr:MAG: adenylyl-sulfate kinase [Gemmatimonadota bacterium]
MSEHKRGQEPKNVFWQRGAISRADRETRRGHRGCVLWFTGLSASGKSTLATHVEERLFDEGYFTFVLDGDNMRHGLCEDLGFSPEDRTENIRRVGQVAKLFAEAGAIVATAFISPYRQDRDRVRRLMSREGDFVEVFVSCPLSVCESRDPKGLYRRARAGEIRDFTGIDAPYEAPEAPELVVETQDREIAECVEQIVDFLRANGYIEYMEAEAVPQASARA